MLTTDCAAYVKVKSGRKEKRATGVQNDRLPALTVYKDARHTKNAHYQNAH